MTSAGERPFGVDLVLPKPVTRESLREALAAVHPQHMNDLIDRRIA
jgi:hypothetical protein